MSLKKRVLALLMAVILALSLCGCSFPAQLFSRNENTFIGTSDYREKIVKFEDMEYRRPDLDAIRSKADSITEMLGSFTPYRKLVRNLNEFFMMLNDFRTMEKLACIRSDIDTSDAQMYEEYVFFLDAATDVSNIYDELMIACSNSYYGFLLDKLYFYGCLDEEYSETGEDGYSPSDEMTELLYRENEYIGQYRQLYNEMSQYPDRSVYSRYNRQMVDIYIELIKVRKEIAEMLGFTSYEEYAYAMHGRDYLPDDLDEYIKAIKEYLVPLYIEAENADLFDAVYELDSMDADTCFGYLSDTLNGLHYYFDDAMDFMTDYDLYSIQASDTKHDSSYTAYLYSYDAPFMYCYPCGDDSDILTFAHEFGHYTDCYVNYNTTYCTDIAETFSQGLEYLLISNMKDEAERQVLTNYKMLDALGIYIGQACYNEFEHRAFFLNDDELTVEGLNALFDEVSDEYGLTEAYSMYDRFSWVGVSHLFEVPFYVISYCVSDSAAFMLYNIELDAPGSGLEMYIALLDEAYRYDFLDLIESCGMESPISAKTIKAMSETMRARLKL